MLPTSAGVEPATSWSPVGRRIQLSHRCRPQVFLLQSFYQIYQMGRRMTKRPLLRIRLASPRPYCAATRRLKTFNKVSILCRRTAEILTRLLWMRTLAWIFVVRLYSKVPLLSRWPIWSTLFAYMVFYHYEKTPIQIYWKFYNKKKGGKLSDKKKNVIFFIFLLKT